MPPKQNTKPPEALTELCPLGLHSMADAYVTKAKFGVRRRCRTCTKQAQTRTNENRRQRDPIYKAAQAAGWAAYKAAAQAETERLRAEQAKQRRRD
jgi:hypothetical protein